MGGLDGPHGPGDVGGAAVSAEADDVSGGGWARVDCFERGQRRRGNLYLRASRSEVRQHGAVVADPHDHRALCLSGDVLADGGSDRQRPFGSDSGGIWVSGDIFSDGVGGGGEFWQRYGGIHGSFLGQRDIRDQPVYFGAASGVAGMGHRGGWNGEMGRADFSDDLYGVSLLRGFRVSGQARMADRAAPSFATAV